MKITIKRANRKTISIKFINNKEAVLTAPIGYSQAKIDAFILSKKSWIQKTEKRLNSDAEYLKEVILYKKGMIFGDFINYNENFKKYYLDLANNFLPNRISKIAKYYGFTYNKVVIKEFKSRWGTCSKDKVIQLNSRLVMLNKRVIDYVIIHELCHTLYMDHQKSFHNKLSSYFTDEKAIKAYLKKHAYLTRIKY